MKPRVFSPYLILFLFFSTYLPASANSPLIETRYCGEPKRDATGNIIRRADVLRAFQQIHPCPSTGLPTGACPYWQKNHGAPLACGGCDSVSNLNWVPTIIKTCTAWYCIDRFERKIYDNGIPNTDACTNVIVNPL